MDFLAWVWLIFMLLLIILIVVRLIFVYCWARSVNAAGGQVVYW